MQTYATANCGGQLSKCPPVTLVDSNDPSIVTADQAAVQMWQQAFPGYPIKTQFIDFNTLISLIYSPNVPADLRYRLDRRLSGSTGLAVAAVRADFHQQHRRRDRTGGQRLDGAGRRRSGF